MNCELRLCFLINRQQVKIFIGKHRGRLSCAMYWLTFFFNGKLLNTRSWNDVLVALRNVRTFYRELPIWIVGISRLTFYGGSCWVMNNDDRVMRQIIIYANFCAIESYVSDFMMLSCNFFSCILYQLWTQILECLFGRVRRHLAGSVNTCTLSSCRLAVTCKNIAFSLFLTSVFFN